MSKFKSFSKRLLKNKSGQGMVEYILILVVVAAIVFVMKDKLVEYVKGPLFTSLTDKISSITSGQ